MQAVRKLLSVLLLLLPCCARAGYKKAQNRKYDLSNRLPMRREGKTVYLDMHVTLSKESPDCFLRNVILVNGMFQPLIEVEVNDTMVVNVFNELPEDYPQLTEGITIHWHGWDMWNNATWYDGTTYVTMCPIAKGTNFTYKFLVDESPGTYFWHDHGGANRADGLQGPLIVRPHRAMRMPFDPIHDERVLFLTDWWHTESTALAMGLNRPMGGSATEASGRFSSSGAPNSLLINGKGSHADCDMNLDDIVPGDNGYAQPRCNVTRLKMPQSKVDGKVVSKGCKHARLSMEPNKRYLIRIINAASMSYLTVCFEGYSVILVAADTTPTEYMRTSCVDLNTGQRYDVVLQTDHKKKGMPQTNKWISVSTQYQTFAPAAYAIMRFNSKEDLPPTPTPQPGVKPWTDRFAYYISSHEGVLGYVDNYELINYWQSFMHGGSYGNGVLRAAPDKMITLNTSSPSLMENGVPRWVMNGVASSISPPCTSIMADMTSEPGWVAKHTVPTDNASVAAGNAELLGKTDARGLSINLYVDGQPPPQIPALGAYIIELEFNKLIDVIINNVPTADGSGINGRFTEQHPFHMHGHRFWIMGQGEGVFDYDRDEPTLNLYNPMLRDTLTLKANSWAYIRFRSDNPGIWPFHCHIVWHEHMGQKVFFVEAADRIPPKPTGLPECPASCTNKVNPYTRSYINETYPNSKYDLPH